MDTLTCPHCGKAITVTLGAATAVIKQRINDAGLALIKEFEGLRLDVYADPVGLLTVGYGHLIRPEDNLKRGDVITQARADALLREDVTDAEDAVRELVSVPLNDNQFAALVSFVFNLGRGNFEKSTLRRRLNARDYQGAASEFNKWVYAKKKKLPGLVRRRLAERELFLS